VRLDDEQFVRGQYRTRERLETRISVWQPDQDGRWPQDVALDALAAVSPARLLEVGSGTGEFAARCASQLACHVVALDSSPEMVAASRTYGVEAVLGDVQHLPFGDGAFDVAVAAWMLYHAADVDLAIGELARVLRPGGRLVAVTNGREHLAELYRLVDAENLDSSFSRENGRAHLERHFAAVARHEIRTRAVFADRAAAVAYLETLDQGTLAGRLPQFTEPLIAHGTPTVFVADKP
jgi:SAM-dependent methyltransferase